MIFHNDGEHSERAPTTNMLTFTLETSIFITFINKYFNQLSQSKIGTLVSDFSDLCFSALAL